MQKTVSLFIRIVYFCLVLFIIYLVLFCNDMMYSCKRFFEYNNSYYLIKGSLFIILFKILLDKFLGFYKNEPSYKKIIGKFSILLFLFLVFNSYHYYFYTDWDVGVQIIPNSEMIAEGNYAEIDNYYFSIYPNNVLLVFIFSSIIKLAQVVHFENYYMCLVAFQCAIYAVTGYLVYVVSDLLFNEKSYAILIYMLYVMLIGLSPWVVIPYSDSVGLLWPIMIVYFYIKWQQCIKNSKEEFRLLGILVVISYLGYKIKPQIGIIAIAIISIEICDMVDKYIQLKKENRKALKTSGHSSNFVIKKICLVLIGFCMATAIFNLAIYVTHIEINKELTLGPEHFFMMGMNEDTLGVYNQEDVNFSNSITNKQERRKATLDLIAMRLNSYDDMKIYKIIKAKLLTTFNDGTFAWACEGSFFVETFSHGFEKMRTLLENFYYVDGVYFSKFLNFMQSCWVTVFVWGLFAIGVSKNSKVFNVLILSIIGLILFEILFEARARYLFTYVPIFLILACTGLKVVVDSLTFCRRKNNEKTLSRNSLLQRRSGSSRDSKAIATKNAKFNKESKNIV